MDCHDCEDYIPTFDNPYPATPPLQITGYRYVEPLHLCRCVEALQLRTGEDADYIVSRPYKVEFKLDGTVREITVPEGMLTDLASIPWFARIFIGRVGPHLEASIVHDFLYIAWQDIPNHGVKPQDRAFADRLLKVGMAAADVGWLKCEVVYILLRLFGWWAYKQPNPKRYVEDKPPEP